MKAPLFIAAVGALLTSGCVSNDRYAPHESWPERISAKSLKQFEGVYANCVLSSRTGMPDTNGTKLFSFILGPTQGPGHRGEHVDLRFTQDERQLTLRLLDGQSQEIEAVMLQRGVGFEFSGGRLIVYGPYSGLRGDENNFGSGFTVQCDRLHLSTTGGLLGSSSRNGMMLFVMLFPTFVTKEYWWFWPKIEE